MGSRLVSSGGFHRCWRIGFRMALLLLFCGRLVVPCVAGPAQDTLLAVEALITRASKQIPEFARAAEDAAERVVAGGNLYITGKDVGFISEASHRAGGLMMLRRLTQPTQATRGDVALIAPTGDAEEMALCRRLRTAGVRVIAFGAPKGFPADYGFPTLAPTEEGLLAGPKGTRIGSLSPLSDVVQLWAWTGEFVSACLRRGVMPTMFQSVMLPGARERNEPLRAMKFHPHTQAKPVPAGALAREYLAMLAVLVQRLREKELAHLEQVASLVAETRKAGHTVHLWMMGHLPPYVVGTSADAGLFRLWPKVPGELALAKGDVILALGYTGLHEPVLAVAEAARVRVAWVIAPMGSLEAARRRNDLVVDQQWWPGDALVQVPGYDVRILPPSAITQLACYWAIVAEAVHRMRPLGLTPGH